jgi:hypothetical protein
MSFLRRLRLSPRLARSSALARSQLPQESALDFRLDRMGPRSRVSRTGLKLGSGSVREQRGPLQARSRHCLGLPGTRAGKSAPTWRVEPFRQVLGQHRVTPQAPKDARCASGSRCYALALAVSSAPDPVAAALGSKRAAAAAGKASTGRHHASVAEVPGLRAAAAIPRGLRAIPGWPRLRSRYQPCAAILRSRSDRPARH